MCPQPNLLFVFSDQHRASALGCYGNDEVLSPNFDRLAMSGLRLTDYVSNCPVCVPIRPTLLTGLLPPHHGAVANDVGIRDGLEGIADVLNRAGYNTGYIGKWHIDGIPRDKIVAKERRLGFRHWKACNCNHNYMQGYYYDEQDIRHEIDGYEPIAQTDLAIDFIREQTKQPWALYLSWGPPHDPYDLVPKKYLDLFGPDKLTLPPNVPDEIAIAAHVDGKLGKKIIDRETIRHYMHGYYAHIAALDEQMGRLLDVLETQGLRENTIVIYTSDHGDMLGSCGLTGKQLPYQEAFQVPFLLSWPAHVRQGVSDQLISHADLPVSLLGLLGLRFSSPRDGEDFHDIFVRTDGEGDTACLIADYIPAHNAAALGQEAWRGIVTKKYIYASFADHDFVLFDRIQDPYELHNLIHQSAYAAVRDALRRLLLQKLEQHGDRLENTFDFIKNNGYQDAWDASQRHFGLPTTETGKLIW